MKADWNCWHPEIGFDLAVGLWPSQPPKDRYSYKYFDDPTPVGLESWQDQLFDLSEKAKAGMGVLDEDEMRDHLKQYDEWLAQRKLPVTGQILDEVL